MTPYAQAVKGYRVAFTTTAHGYWTARLDQAWANMTDAEKAAEPFVMDHHYNELVEKGLIKPVERKALPPPDQDMAKGFMPPDDSAEAVRWMRRRIITLEHQLSWQQTQYAKLNEIYTKLADCWNAFQATTKPIQRDIHRAEAAGEMARRLAEMILRIVYNTGKWSDLLRVLNSFAREETPKAPADTPPLLPPWK